MARIRAFENAAEEASGVAFPLSAPR